MTANELKEVLTVIYEDEDYDDDAIEMFMRMVNLDGEQMINYEELAKLFCANWNTDVNDELKILFRMFDVNGDRKISKRELVGLMKFFDEEHEESRDETKEVIKKVMKKFDEDGDGQLNYEEFCNLLADFESDD